MPARPLQAAGGVVYRKGHPGTGPEFLLVHRSRYHDWSLPKGKLDSGESFEDAALREILEETGFDCELHDYLGAVFYETQRRRRKLVRYWLMKADTGSFNPNLEVDKAEWMGIHGARALLTYSRDVRIIERAAALLENKTATRLHVLRHANASGTSQWKGQDKRRPLTEKGQQQAHALSELLSRYPISEIRSSSAVRCRATVEPLAANLQTNVRTTKRLKRSAGIDVILEYVGSVGPGAIVLSTHKEWIGALIEELDRRGVPLRGSRRWPRSSMWVFDVVDGKVSAGYYGGSGIS